MNDRTVVAQASLPASNPGVPPGNLSAPGRGTHPKPAGAGARATLIVLAAATVCAVAHYTFGDWVSYPHVALWRQRAFWVGIPFAAVVPVLHWVGWSVLSLGRLKPARVIFVAGIALCLGDLVWLLVWLNLNAASGIFHLSLQRTTVEWGDLWSWWMPAVLLIGNAVLGRRWWRVVRQGLRNRGGDGSSQGLAGKRVAHGDLPSPSLSAESALLRSRLSVLVWGIAAVAGILVVFLGTAYLVLPRMRVNETTLSLAETFIVGARWEKDFQVLARDPSLQGKRLGAILAHAELAHLQRQQFYHELEESTYQQYVLSPIVDALPVAEVDWRRTLWEAFYPRVRNEHDPVAAARVVVRALRERVGIDASYAYRVGPETVWELGMADEKGFARIYVAALRSVGIAARLGEAGQAEFWDGRAWQPAPRPLPSFSPDHTGQEGT